MSRLSPLSINVQYLQGSLADDNLSPIDGDPVTRFKTVSLCIRLSRLERTINRDQPSKDAYVWPRHCFRQFQQDAQGWVSSIPPPSLSDPDHGCKLILQIGEEAQNALIVQQRHHRLQLNDCTFKLFLDNLVSPRCIFVE